MKTATLAAVLCAALIAGCGGSDKTSATSAKPAPRPTTTIRISNYLYTPDPAAVRVGQKVTIVNADATEHTLTAKPSGQAFDSGTIKANGSGSVTFSKAGTYSYYCQFHPTMLGKVTVLK